MGGYNVSYSRVQYVLLKRTVCPIEENSMSYSREQYVLQQSTICPIIEYNTYVLQQSTVCPIVGYSMSYSRVQYNMSYNRVQYVLQKRTVCTIYSGEFVLHIVDYTVCPIVEMCSRLECRAGIFPQFYSFLFILLELSVVFQGYYINTLVFYIR